MDGRVLTELLHPEFVGVNPVEYHGVRRPKGEVQSLTSKEEQELLRRLRDLGYVD
jgi:hypothetical protein